MPNSEDIRKRVMELQREIDAIHISNVNSAMLTHSNPNQRIADNQHERRLKEIAAEVKAITTRKA